MTTSSC